MRITYLGVTALLLACLTGQASQTKEGPVKSAEAPKEETVVDHESKTMGALQVKAVSDGPADWFDVFQYNERAISGNPPRLNSTIEIAPGTYIVSVNRTQRKVTIAAGKKAILLTGELVVEGAKGSGDWFTPYQGKDRKVVSNPPTINTPIALFAGKYTVTLRMGLKDKDLGEAEVTAGRKTVLKI
jgi:hypothetical protein